MRAKWPRIRTPVIYTNHKNLIEAAGRGVRLYVYRAIIFKQFVKFTASHYNYQLTSMKAFRHITYRTCYNCNSCTVAQQMHVECIKVYKFSSFSTLITIFHLHSHSSGEYAHVHIDRRSSETMHESSELKVELNRSKVTYWLIDHSNTTVSCCWWCTCTCAERSSSIRIVTDMMEVWPRLLRSDILHDEPDWLHVRDRTVFVQFIAVSMSAHLVCRTCQTTLSRTDTHWHCHWRQRVFGSGGG